MCKFTYRIDPQYLRDPENKFLPTDFDPKYLFLPKFWQKLSSVSTILIENDTEKTPFFAHLYSLSILFWGQCPTGDGKPSFLFFGTNNYFAKENSITPQIFCLSAWFTITPTLTNS